MSTCCIQYNSDHSYNVGDKIKFVVAESSDFGHRIIDKTHEICESCYEKLAQFGRDWIDQRLVS